MPPEEIELELGVIELPAFTAHVVRRGGCGAEDLGPTLSAALETVFALGLEFTGPPMIAYIEIPDGGVGTGEVTIDAIIPVEATAAAAAGLPVQEIAALGLTASVRFRGPHELIPRAYQELFQFVEEQRYAPTGLPRELYWEHHEDQNHLTELCLPVTDLLPEGQRQYEPV
ncbi:MAG: GyrI-like domain-containing protein [bacterium]